MITEDYVSFETAKLLKEKGFDEVCRTSYETITNKHKVEDCSPSSWGKLNQVKRPTLQMAMKWLREVHNKSIEVRSQGLKSTGLEWVTGIYNLKNQDEEYYNSFTQSSYEQACEAAIQYCLENLI